MFSGKTVIITGSSSGIGAHAAIEFAKQSANVVLHGRNESNLKEVKQHCLSMGSVKKNQVTCVIGDICHEDVQTALIDAALKNYKRIDVLINNAGVVKETPIDGFLMGNFNDIINVNLNAVVSLSLKAVSHLKKTKGCIVNVSSVAAVKAGKGLIGYCVSKAALDGFTKALSAELAADGVRVNSVNPGPIPETSIGRDHPNAEKIMTFKLVPMQQFGTTVQTEEAILFLASERSSYTTGQILFVDGGMHGAGLITFD